VSITFTRKAFLEVWRGDVFISKHVNILEAGESAAKHSEVAGPGIYQVKVGDCVYYEIDMSFILGSAATTEEANPPIPPGPRDLHFDGPLNQDGVLDRDELVDGFLIRTLPEPQSGSETVSVTTGGAGSGSGLDTRVVASITPPSNGNGAANPFLPRKGPFFISSQIHHDKQYKNLNNGVDNKPRSFINLFRENLGGSGFVWDVEMYWGFTIALPSNHEIDTKSRRLTYMTCNANGADTNFKLEIHSVDGNAPFDKWIFLVTRDDSDIDETPSAQTFYELSADPSTPRPGLELVNNDFDTHVDFVLRWRLNPFTGVGGPTNANTVSGGRNQLYEHDKGIMQVWKTSGLDSVDADGNRPFYLTQVNFVDQDIGLVPRAANDMNLSLRVYKPQWIQQSTTVVGPIWNGFDEIRHGEVLRDMTTFKDVNPGRLSAP